MAQTAKKGRTPAQKKVPERRCVGCGGTFLKKDLLRVVRSPEGEISIDFSGKKSGRGAYICASSACLAKARKQKQLERAFECAVDAAAYEALEASVREAEGAAV